VRLTLRPDDGDGREDGNDDGEVATATAVRRQAGQHQGRQTGSGDDDDDDDATRRDTHERRREREPSR
jgi:hypothetical protein